MKIPRKFSVMGLEFRVIFQPPMKDGLEQFGYTEYASQTVCISPNITPKAQEQTFLHELLHIIWWQMGLDRSIDDKQEELIVNSLANGLFANLKLLK